MRPLLIDCNKSNEFIFNLRFQKRVQTSQVRSFFPIIVHVCHKNKDKFTEQHEE